MLAEALVPAAFFPLRLLRYVLVSNVRTGGVLLPFVSWMAIETGATTSATRWSV